MADNLCKKHSFGYEPLKVIGLNVAGKDCLLCLAEENTKFQAENKLLKEALEKIRDDWKTKENPSERSYCELVAIANQALRETSNE